MSFWTSLRDTVESAATLVGNYILPGSALITDQLVSKGSQAQLSSTIGQILNVASGVTGGVNGNLANYGKVLGSLSTATGIGATASTTPITYSAAEMTSATQALQNSAQAAGGTMTAEQATAAANAYAQAGYPASSLISTSQLSAAVSNGTMTMADATTISNAGGLSNIANNPTLLNSLSAPAQTFLSSAAGKALISAGISGIAGGLAANQVANNQINPSQYVVDPTTGQVISSSVVNNQGTTSTGNAQTTALNNTAQAGLSGNLTNFQSQLAPLTNQLSTLYNTEGANTGGYVQSVVNPVKQAGAAAYGTQVQNNALRGITGSSLANESLTNTANTNANNVANATAGALQSSLGLQQVTTNAQAQLASTGYNAGLGTAQAQEGLGTTITNQNLALMGKGQVAQTAGVANANQLSQAQGNAISGVGNALTNALGQTTGLGGTATGQTTGLGGTATMPSDVSQIPAGADGYNGASWYSPSTNTYYNANGSIVW